MVVLKMSKEELKRLELMGHLKEKQVVARPPHGFPQ